MVNIARRTLLEGIASATALSAMGVASAADGRDQFVVTARGGGVERRLERAGATVLDSIADGRVLLVAAESADAADVRGVRSVEPNRGYRPVGPAKRSTEESLDEQFAAIQWDKQADTTGAFEAHDTATGEGRSVATIDTGIDTEHPDLRNAVARGKLFRADGAVSPDGSPTADGDVDVSARLPPAEGKEIDSYVYLGAPATREQAAGDDVDSHGSHCAGIATAKHDDTSAGEDFGIAGMAPDAEVVPLRVFYWKELASYPYDEDGDGEDESVTVTTLWTTDYDILGAIDYAAEIGVDAANMSLGGGVIKGSAHSTGEHVAHQTVIQSAVRRGTVVTTSAGNADADLQHGGYYTLPNSVPGSISVSATGPNNERVFYSNYGTSDIDVGAPGGGYETLEKTLTTDEDAVDWPYPLNLVYSTVPPDLNDGTAYAWYAGTSMAAPQVAGLVALLREVDPDLSAKQVQSVIENTARFSRGKRSADVGAGVIHAPSALDRASK